MSYRQQGYRPQARQSQPARGATSRSGGKAPPRNPRSKKRRRGFRAIRIFLVLAVFAFTATLAVTGYMIYEEVGSVERENTFYRGVYIDDIELHGYTPQEAHDMLINRARTDMQDWSLTIFFGDRTWTLDAENLGMNRSLETIVPAEINRAFFIGRGDGDLLGIIDRYKTIVGLRTEPYKAYTSGIEKNTAIIDTILAEIDGVVYVEPQDATQGFDPNRKNAIIVTDETYGRRADIEALKTEIVARVNSMEGGSIQVPTVDIEPTIRAETLKGDVAKLASFSTRISTQSTQARVDNIRVGCDKFNGKSYPPGAKISFNDVVGKRTLENGFFEAEELVYGAYEIGVGGGICQVSTTLYNAVVQAGLEVVSRTNHSVPVRYAERGSDATVYDGRIDFVFRNNTNSTIYITAIQTTRDGNKICQVEIYGAPNENNVSYKLHHVEEEVPVPAKVERIRDRNGDHATYTDQEVTVEGSVGYRITSYLMTLDASGNVITISDKVFSKSYYPPTSTKVYTGIQKRP